MRDRRDIASLLLPHFPFMAGASSADWQAFLNEKTGLHITDEKNSAAFDKWRKALAEKHGLPVWGYSKESETEMKERGQEMLEKEQAWRAANPGKASELDAQIEKFKK